MKKILASLIFLPVFSLAQSMGIKDIPVGQDTSIHIKKGSEKVYEIVEGEAEIEGDAAPLLQDARSNWKASCSEWKKEIRELNKENHVISLSCGKMNCARSTMESVCQSKGGYKLKVKMKD